MLPYIPVLYLFMQEAYSEDRVLYTDKVMNQLLSALYQLEVVEETTFLEWANHPSISPEARKSLSPFLTWLQEADEDEDE